MDAILNRVTVFYKYTNVYDLSLVTISSLYEHIIANGAMSLIGAFKDMLPLVLIINSCNAWEEYF